MYVTSAAYAGDFGDRAASKTICTNDEQYVTFGCFNAFAAIGYTGDVVQGNAAR